MEIKTFDILLLFILAITVALIIGINVIYVIDKKLSDIKINVPPCPAPNVYVRTPSGILTKVEVDHIDRSNLDRMIVDNRTEIPRNNIMNETVNRRIPYQQPKVKKPTNDPIPNTKIPIGCDRTIHSHTDNRRINNGNMGSLGSVKAIEGFESVQKSNDGPNAKPLVVNDNGKLEKVLLRQGYSTAGSDTNNTGDKITYPDSSSVVRYSQPGCYRDLNTASVRRVSVNKINQPNCKLQATDGKMNNYKTGFVTASGNIVNQNVDFYIPRVYMGVDPYIRGPDYAEMQLEQHADIDQIGSIPVNDWDGSPQPMRSFITD